MSADRHKKSRRCALSSSVHGAWILTLTLAVGCRSVPSESAPPAPLPSSDVDAESQGEREDLPAPPSETASSRGTFTLGLDNDIVLFKDDGYTAGGNLEWVAGELSTLGDANVFNQLRRWASFLPRMDDDSYRHYASASFNYEMYTPSDLEANPPPPDQQPYAGIMAVDTGLYARSEKAMHAYGLRLGIVGPATGAAQVQKWLHEKLGSDPPNGWEHQLSNEPLVNAYYRYQRRLTRKAPSKRFGFDVMGDYGGGLGNYYTGAAVSGLMRLGYNVPDYHSVNLVPTTRQVMVGMTPGEGSGFSAFLSLYVQGMATLRFLPTDGNTFTESASVDRDVFSADLTSGLFLMYGHLMLAVEAHNWNDMFDADVNRNRQYGTLRISWML